MDTLQLPVVHHYSPNALRCLEQSWCSLDLCSTVDSQPLSDGRTTPVITSDQAGPERHTQWRRWHHAWRDGQSGSPIPQGYLEQAYDNFSTYTRFSDRC